MIDKVKLMAMYLPQYHEIPENDEFWGKGFTDWTTVKSAKQYFKDVKQPKVPLNDNYYDLSKMETLEWQVKLAKEYGIDGFCFYHYWFSSNKQLLQTPAENFLKNKELDIHFCFAWDNAPWKRTWSTQFGNDWAPIFDDDNVKQKGPSLLINFEYGTEQDWEKHFNYLLPFFKDTRYLKKGNKPVFILWNYYEIDKIKRMLKYWNKRAVDFGFDGVYVIFKFSKKYETCGLGDASFFYEPIHAGWERSGIFSRIMVKMFRIVTKGRFPRKYSYDVIWMNILRQAKKYKYNNVYYGSFVNYDDTPRRGADGRLVSNGNPIKFCKYLKKLFCLSKNSGKEFVFLTAWNEWGEGAYLEPDKYDKFDYLKMILKLKR